jgi:uncharacterized RDD family membrane protein YckC
VSPRMRRDPRLPARGSRLGRLARHSLIVLAACLAVALAVIVASGIGQVELLVLIALVLLLWPMILGRIRDRGPASSAGQRGPREEVGQRQKTD